MSSPGHSAIERAVLAVLRPLIKVALKRGMAHGRFSDLAKEAYVDASRELASEPGKKPNASRISIQTGLTRREVGRLLKDEGVISKDSPRTRFNRAARVLGAWCEDADFRDGRGGPAALPFESEEDVSFSDLVRAHGADVPPRAVLDELLSVGAVRQQKDGRFRLLERGYVPRSDEDEKLAILGADVADLVSTIEHNLDPEASEPFFQRKVSYDNLPAGYLPKLRALVRKDAQQLLEKLNRDMAKQDRDLKPASRAARVGRSAQGSEAEDRHRAMIGIYFYQEELDDEDA
ncbi:MAG: DUF6502 family protein [Myxococcota bacterium]